MKIKAITNYLLKQYPLSLQEEWDESGFVNRGLLTQETRKFFVCLDLNQKIIDQAIKQKANLIVSHHPIFSKNPDHKLLWYYLQLLEKAKRHKITILSLHTCFDNSRIGMNFLVGEKLRLKNLQWYKKTKLVSGYLPKALTIKQIASLFKKVFGVSNLTTNAKPSDKFKKLVICGGAGLSVFEPKYEQIAREKALIVTGDIKHHGWQDIANYKLNALDVGHDLENCFCDFMASLIKQEYPSLTVYSIKTTKKEKPI